MLLETTPNWTIVDLLTFTLLIGLCFITPWWLARHYKEEFGPKHRRVILFSTLFVLVGSFGSQGLPGGRHVDLNAKDVVTQKIQDTYKVTAVTYAGVNSDGERKYRLRDSFTNTDAECLLNSTGVVKDNKEKFNLECYYRFTPQLKPPVTVKSLLEKKVKTGG